MGVLKKSDNGEVIKIVRVHFRFLVLFQLTYLKNQTELRDGTL